MYSYRSGKKVKEKYKLDYCSKPWKVTFDQWRLWKVWGVDLTTNKDRSKDIGLPRIGCGIRTLVILYSIMIVLL
jgi:hypothetical protein